MANSPGKLVSSIVIPPHTGGTGHLKAGQTLRIIDIEGEQVADFVAIRAGDPTEYLDCVYTSWDLGRWKWHEGDRIKTNLLNDLFTITDDKTDNHYTGGGFCSNAARRKYAGMDGPGCRDTIRAEFQKNGFDPELLQSVSCYNIFMTVDYTPEGEWVIRRPVTQPGDYIDLRAEMDLTWMVSVCAWPQVVNGDKPTPLQFDTFDAAG